MPQEEHEKLQQLCITYRNKSIHIFHDEVMEEFLENVENGVLALAEFVLQEYQRRMDKPLDITKDSLAIEIIIHVYADNIAENLQMLPEEHGGKIRSILGALGDKARTHTQTIDCGEQSVDSNRLIWDGLVPFKHIIYGFAKKDFMNEDSCEL